MELSPLYMFPCLLFFVLIGVPVAFALMGTALLFGLHLFGPAVPSQFAAKVNSVASNFELVAVPLFVFMGVLLERSGIAEKLLEAAHIWTRRLPGGLALGTVIMCVLFAASSGVIGATETIVGLLVAPVMVRYAYDKKLVSGVICAGGSLGTIIPPSIVAVVLGPLASVSVGALFASMLVPGLGLAALYILYVLSLCLLRPEAGPVLPQDESLPSLRAKLAVTARGVLPPVFLILCVLGSIMSGLAAPSEAAALGALGAVILCLASRSLSWRLFQESLLKTLKITSMIMFIILGGNMFTGVFVGAGGGIRIEEILQSIQLSPYATLLLILLAAFLSGFFLDWISILLVFVPVFIPIMSRMGFDKLWLCTLFLLVVQTSYLTPPMAPAVFYFRAIKPREIKTGDILRGVVPFIILQLLAIALVVLFPGLVLWLPGKMGL